MNVPSGSIFDKEWHERQQKTTAQEATEDGSDQRLCAPFVPPASRLSTMRLATSRSACVAVLLWLTVILQLTGHASCLAATSTTSSTPSDRITSVVSTKKNGGHSRTFSFQDTDAQTKQARRQKLDVRSLANNIQSGLRSTFLPSGFPVRTPKGYLQYSIWSWIQDLSTQLRAVLATQRVLEGIGVGREGATALSALMNFIVRDGCGMAATLLFTSVAASRFKADIKRWRLFADIMVDIGITLEVAAGQVAPGLFLPMICVGNMCKAICGVAAGACGGAINLHWAVGSDISDINAKFGAQHTVTGSLGLVFAALFAKSVSTVKLTHLWILYSALTALHIFANMRCMRLIAFNSLNTVRMDLLVSDFFESWSQQPPLPLQPAETTSVAESPSASLPPPISISQQEPLFFWPRLRRRKLASIPIHFGVSFNEFSEQSGKSLADLQTLMSSDAPYWVSSGHGQSSGAVVVAIRTDATPTDQAKAYFHALLLGQELQRQKNKSVGSDNADAAERAVQAEKVASAGLEHAWSTFETKCRQAGWDLAASELRTRGYEIDIER
jgi:hypothetical protein